jgi:hypothetical protein
MESLSRMRALWGKLTARLVLAVIAVVFVAVFAASQYDLVRDTVRFICINCLGLGG